MPAVNSEILVWARKTAGLTIEDAVAKLHIKDERLAALERGEQDPTRPTLVKMAQHYTPAASHLLPVRASTARGSWRGFPRTPCGSIIRDGTAHRRTRPRRAEPPEHGPSHTGSRGRGGASAVHRNPDEHSRHKGRTRGATGSSRPDRRRLPSHRSSSSTNAILHRLGRSRSCMSWSISCWAIQASAVLSPGTERSGSATRSPQSGCCPSQCSTNSSLIETKTSRSRRHG